MSNLCCCGIVDFVIWLVGEFYARLNCPYPLIILGPVDINDAYVTVSSIILIQGGNYSPGGGGGEIIKLDRNKHL